MSVIGPRLPSSASARDGSYRGISCSALSTTAESNPQRPSSEWIAGLNLATRPLVSITLKSKKQAAYSSSALRPAAVILTRQTSTGLAPALPRDPRLGDRDQLAASSHLFGRQGHKSFVDQASDQARVEAVRAQQRLCRAVMAGGREHGESAALRLPSLRP
jgi:hypothetical protein